MEVEVGVVDEYDVLIIGDFKLGDDKWLKSKRVSYHRRRYRS